MEPLFLIIDLFCGFGGTTTGFEDAMYVGPDGKLHQVCKVIACVNHDPKAIKSHWMNHPHVKHFEEDIRTLDLTELVFVLNHYRKLYPNAKVVLWASLECTNFSKAKGGQPRDADSRTLAEHLFRYQEALNPDYIKIENVVEFMSWGPLDENGKPVSNKNGEDFLKWKKKMSGVAYYSEWKELNSADFGGHTSRNRLFGCFAKHHLPIVWPGATHSKTNDMFNKLEKWKPVKDMIDFSDTGKSIFNRKKPLADRTIKGLIKGIKKYTVKGQECFLYHYYGNSCQTSLNEPCSTFRTKQSVFLVSCFLHNPSWGQGSVSSINAPAPVIIARQDKAPLRIAMASAEGEDVTIYESDSECYKEIKRLMIKVGIKDIFYRALRIKEKLLIQGFPSNYHTFGTQADADKFIGNSVHPKVPKAWAEAFALKFMVNKKLLAA